ncbi:universal stress protein [Fulvivirga kasyanovii]|uniref:Universal stress protein n=1 Tax=Fulvivirga kasyanovii TaxID=396812 RepID=A0ABW9RMW7_9BACT|nr:universal stress protein [Fulvivirga kasyanovii]MTI25448.1 universal stress protein [Fulvivirga kasyanovii]
MAHKKILVPIDFSKCSKNALKYAIHMGKRMPADLLLMHAFSIPVTHGEMGAASIVGTLVSGIEEDIERDFARLVDELPELAEVKYETIIKHGSVVDAFILESSHFKPDMVVMGTKGAHGIDEVILGTNAYAVAKNSKFPVLIIPESAGYRPLKKIALASDYKDAHLGLFDPLLMINNVFGAEIHIVHISKENDISPEEAEEAKKMQRYFKDVPHHYHLLQTDDIEEGLNSYCHEHDIDLLTLVPRKHQLFEVLMKGRQSKKIIFHTEIPVLALST